MSNDFAEDDCQSLVAAQAPVRQYALPVERLEKLQELYQNPEQMDTKTEDFMAASIARDELQKIIDQLNEEFKPSAWQQLGFMHQSRREKATEAIRASANSDLSELKALVDGLEAEWKERHGLVYAAFKTICKTLDDHRSILKVFPSQNDYASPLVGSITIIMKAAKSHTEISLLLSKSIAEISSKVATCSTIVNIISTPRARQKLAAVYARMFQFYQQVLEWYLQSRFGRFLRSFNENLLKQFEDTKSELGDDINELYREAAVASTAMMAILNGRMANLEAEILRQRQSHELKDKRAGERIERMMCSTWSELRTLKDVIERASSAQVRPLILAPNQLTLEAECRISDGLVNNHASHLNGFVIDHDGQKSFANHRFWVADMGTMMKLRSWTQGSAASRTLWVTSPYEAGITMPGSRAAAIATVSAARQAETPIISVICKRVRQDQLRTGMSIEQVGLISLAYDLIVQLLQFSSVASQVTPVQEAGLGSLNGEASTWADTLRMLEALLKHVPTTTFCVIDGLNELELGNGGEWCKQLLAVLMEKQQQPEGAFNILFSTSGQSYVLSNHVDIRNRHWASKRATELHSSGAIR